MVLQENSVSILNRRAQSIGVNTTVIIALAIIVLVVLLAIFGKGVLNYNRGIVDATPVCTAQSGECKDSCAPDIEITPPSPPDRWTDCAKPKICCKKVAK